MVGVGHFFNLIFNRRLAKKYNFTITHISEQSGHNKDRCDGEFPVVKTSLNRYVVQTRDEDYVEVNNSKTLAEFGNRRLSKPDDRAMVSERIFINVTAEKVRNTRDQIPAVKTVTGIKSVFQIIIKIDGEVLFRKYPCFCTDCCNMKWDECRNYALVGKVKKVVEAGQDLTK